MEELFGEQPWVQPLSTAGSNIPNEMGTLFYEFYKLKY